MNRRDLLQTCGCALGALGTLGTLAGAGPALAAVPWRSMWDGRSLTGWSRLGDAAWTIEGGLLACEKGSISYLVSDESFADFEFKVEFWASEDANSGIFIRCTDPADVTPANSYEVNIFDTRPDQAYATGAIVGVAKVVDMPRAGGRWNVMKIAAKGDRLSVMLNGRRTVDNVQDARHAQGRITLQYGAGVVKFRQVLVRPI